MAECPSCGEPLTSDHVFCPRCGLSVKEMESGGTPPAVTSTESDAVCPTCGAGLPTGARFCGECGTPLESDFRLPASTTTDETAVIGRTYRDNAYGQQHWAERSLVNHRRPHPGQYDRFGHRSSSLGGFLAFRRIITPDLIGIIFWLAEVLNLFYWVQYIYYARYRALYVIFGLIGLVTCALLICAIVEAIVVVLRSDERISDIERKMRER